MNKEIADRWTKALRSGRYKKTRYQLKGIGCYCSLGVLCHISNLGKFSRTLTIFGSPYLIKDGVPSSSHHGYTQGVPPEITHWSGMNTKTGDLNNRLFKNESITNLNDEGDLSFKEIADIIDKYWEDL